MPFPMDLRSLCLAVLLIPLAQAADIPIDTEEPMTFVLRIKWCQPIGPGWYLSGGKFLKVIPSSEAFKNNLTGGNL